MSTILQNLSGAMGPEPKLDLALARLLALNCYALGQTKTLDALSMLKVLTAKGKRLDAPTLKAALARLTQAKVLMQHESSTFRINPYHQFAILLDLSHCGQLHDCLAALRKQIAGSYTQFTYQSPDEAFAWRELLWQALEGDLDGCIRWGTKWELASRTQKLPSIASFLLATKDGTDIFRNLRLDIQALLLEKDLLVKTGWLLPCTASYQYLVAFLPEFTTHPKLVTLACHQARLRDDTTGLTAASAHLPPVDQHLNTAMGALQKGEYAAANQCYAQAIQLVRGTSKKRKIQLPELDTLLYVLAGIGENSATSRSTARELVGEGYLRQRSDVYLALRCLMEHLVTGAQQPPLRLQRTTIHITLESLLETIACAWLDFPFNDRWQSLLQQERLRLADNGYAWVAAELDALISGVFDEAPLYPDWHQQRGLKPLVATLAHEEPWQRALTALAALNKPASAASRVEAQRLAWWISSIPHVGYQLEPREQKCSAKGVWSKGRPVSLKRLATQPELVAGITEQDKRLALCIRRNHDYYGPEYELSTERALPELINHPAVYWSDAPDVRIDVAAGEVALQLSEKGGQIHLKLNPYLPVSQSCLLRKITPTRVAVYVNTPELKQITGILGEGLSVPSAAKAQLVEVISAIAPHIAIHSDLPELAAHMASIPADTTLFAHLLPLNEGLRLQLLQRPLPDGSWFPPGSGAANVVGEVNGEPVQAVRQLKDEKKQLAKLLDACPSLEDAEQTQGELEWQLEHPEHCLELLSELKAQPESVVQLVWPQGERMRLSGNRGLKQLRLSVKKQGEWFEADGDITLDDGRVLALRELIQLMNDSPGRFLKLGDNDYLALTNNFRKRLLELNAYAETTAKGGLRINPLAAPALAELADEVGELKADSAWQAQVKKLDGLANFTPTLPAGLRAELRDYQLDGYHWLARLAHWGVGACLADDMGLGKTVQALALLLDRAPQGPALVIAPLSVAMNWLSEAQKFAPSLRMRGYHSNRDLSGLGAGDVVVASYGMLQQDAELFAQQHWHSVVLDEAQAIKNAATKRSQAAMALTADFKMIASGTPVENHLGELWNLFRFINPGLLGSKERFAKRFSTPIENGDSAARGHLKKLIQPFMLRRTKSQVLAELPARTEITLQVELSDAERHLYEALRQQAMDNIATAGKGTPMQVLAEITKLRRFCCNPKLAIKNSQVPASKLAVFTETLAELLDNKHKALVFSQFVDHLAIVREHLDNQGIDYQYLDGSTPAADRKKRVDAFQAGAGDVFLISLKAGGTGLNLTAADYVIHLDPWWNPAVEDQASDRAHRMGQQRPVTIYRLVTQGTIEEKIIGLHSEKRDLADSLLDGGEAAGRLDTAALLSLLKESV